MNDREREAMAILRKQIRLAKYLGPTTWADFRAALKRRNWPSDAGGKIKPATWRVAWLKLRTRFIAYGWVDEDRAGVLSILV